MKNRNNKFWLAILVIALVFGMMVIGCGETDDGNDSALNGTWVLNGTTTYTYELKFGGGKYEASRNDQPYTKGTYNTQEGEIIIQTTHIHGNYFSSANIEGLESKWYTRDELKLLTNADDTTINRYYSIQRGPYSVNGSTLTISFIGGGGGTYTKK